MLSMKEIITLEVAGFSVLEKGECFCNLQGPDKRIWILIMFPIEVYQPVQLYLKTGNKYVISESAGSIEEAIRTMKIERKNRL